jgi:hypothetical protein
MVGVVTAAEQQKAHITSFISLVSKSVLIAALWMLWNSNR